MSGKLVGKVYDIYLPHDQQAIMIALADHGNDFGEHIHPSIDYLAWKTGYHRRNVQKILRKLEELQLLIPVAYEQGGRGLATVYEMHLENGTTKPPFKRRERPKKDGFNATVSDGQKDGDVTTLSEKSAKRVASHTQRVASHTQRVASHTQKGGVGATPTVIEPSYEPSEEPAPISRSRKNEEAAEPEPEPPPFRAAPPAFNDFARDYRKQHDGIRTRYSDIYRAYQDYCEALEAEEAEA